MASAQENPKDLVEGFLGLLPFSLPGWAVTTILVVVFLGALYGLIVPLSPALKAVGRGSRRLFRRRDKRREVRRGRFADHVESQMRRLAEKEEWRDSRYAELEAELEITEQRRSLFRS